MPGRENESDYGHKQSVHIILLCAAFGVFNTSKCVRLWVLSFILFPGLGTNPYVIHQGSCVTTFHNNQALDKK